MKTRAAVAFEVKKPLEIVERLARGHRLCCRGWGVSVVIGVADAGEEISTRLFRLVIGSVSKGSAFGVARGCTYGTKIVDWCLSGKIQIDPLITHILKLGEVDKGFELTHAGRSIR